MKWLFLIDPLGSLHLETDSTFAIMQEAYRQGVQVYYCTVQDLCHKSGIAGCRACIFPPEVENFKFNSPEDLPLDSFGIIFMRKDPPYDIIYHYTTQLLSLTRTTTINAAEALRNFNEKLIILAFPSLIPETLVTTREDLIFTFLDAHPSGIALKSLDSFQGRSVEWVQDASPASVDLVKSYTRDFSVPVMVQAFLPQVFEGDKRVLVLGGKIIGAVMRVPPQGSFLANFAQGGVGECAEITSRDVAIVRELAPFLLRNGLHFVGIDVIGGYLTEINITCPTGIVQINALNDTRLEKEVVTYFLHISGDSL